MSKIPADDQTLLDSRFGASQAAKEFKEMGLPDKPPRRRRVMIAVGLAALMAILIGKFSGESDASRQNMQISELQSTLRKACQAGDWGLALSTLSKLPPDHPSHSAVPHLKCLDCVVSQCKLRNWEKAYELLADFPRHEPGLEGLAMAVDQTRKKINLEVQAREWLKESHDDLPSLCNFLTRLDPSSVYHPEVTLQIEDLRKSLLADLESQLEQAIADNDFQSADKALKSWSSQLPGLDPTSWMQKVNEAREGHILVGRLQADILTGQFIRAMGLMSEAPTSGSRALEVAALKKGLEAASDKQDLLSTASARVASGDLESLQILLAPLGQDNAVGQLFLQRATELLEHRKALHTCLEAGHDGRPEALKHARAILALGIPGDFLSGVVKLEGELSEDVAGWVVVQEKLLRDSWDRGDFMTAYTISGKLLSMGGAPEWVSAQRDSQDRAGERLADEIYILSGLDRELAMERLRILESCLPPGHPAVVLGRSYLEKQ